MINAASSTSYGVRQAHTTKLLISPRSTGKHLTAGSTTTATPLAASIRISISQATG
jgi:hypothetical protein